MGKNFNISARGRGHSHFLPWSTEQQASAERIRNYFRHVAAHSHNLRGRHASIAAHRGGAASYASQGFLEPDASQGSNMTFSQSNVSGLTSMGTVYSGTPAANRQAIRAKRILRGVRASATRPTALKAAMFLPGKGAEVELIANNYLQPIIHKIPWKYAKLRYDGITSGLENPKGNRVSMDFAYKMILECQHKGMQARFSLGSGVQIVPTRFHCAHLFRHVNGNANASEGTATGTNTAKWHSTLGPDASYIRLLPAAGGTLQGGSVFDSTYGNTVSSPFRFPEIGATMYTRMSLQTLENIGWNLNPLKITGMLTDTDAISAFANVATAGTGSNINQSAPNVQMLPTVAHGPSANKYITQHGPGGVRYNFSNDGTNAVTIECVIIAFKESANSPTETDYGLTKPYDTFMKTAGQAYFNRMAAKKGIQALAGDEHKQMEGGYRTGAGAAIFSNAETEFIPNNIFPFMGKLGTLDATDNTNAVIQPFKYVSRDQFIIGGGQSRIWKTSFPSDVYDASMDSPQITVSFRTCRLRSGRPFFS